MNDLIEELALEYTELRNPHGAEIKKIQEEAQAKIDALLADVPPLEEREKRFAIKLVTARNAGYTREQLALPVLRTNSNKAWRKWVELGGGSIRTLRTGLEIREEFEAAARATEAELLEGLTYLGYIRPWGDANEVMGHSFEIDGGDRFYLIEDVAMPYKDDAGLIYDWIRANKERVKLLAAHYNKGEN